MIFTVADAKAFIQDTVRGGTCDAVMLLKRVNECQLWLVNCPFLDPRWMRRRIKVMVRNDSFTCPREFGSVIAGKQNNTPIQVRTQAFEYLEGGPENIDTGSYAGEDFEDLGNRWPTFYEIPYEDSKTDSIKLVAFSTEHADEALTLHVLGRGALLNEIRTAGAPGEHLTINRWEGGVEGSFMLGVPTLSAGEFCIVDQVIKPVTAGYVSLWTYDTTTNKMYFLGKYHPEETQPGYRRYKVINHVHACDVPMVLLCELAYSPAVYNFDALIIQNLPAIRLMSQAIEAFDSGDPVKAENLKTASHQTLLEQLKKTAPRSNEINFQMDAYAGANIENVV